MKKRRLFLRLARILIFLAIMGVILLAGIGLRNFLLNEIKERLSGLFSYSHVRLSLTPPGVLFEDVQLTRESPAFTARQVIVRVKLFSLLSREKPVSVFIDGPVISYRHSGGKKLAGRFLAIPAPFILEEVRVRRAEVTVASGENSLKTRNLKGGWKQKGDRFTIKAEAEDANLILGQAEVIPYGRLKTIIDGRGRELNVRQLLMEGSDRFFKLKGTVKDLASPEFSLAANFWMPLPEIANWLHLPFSWEGGVASEGQISWREGRLAYEGQLKSPDLQLNGYSLGPSEGWTGLTLGKRGDLRLKLDTPSGLAELLVSWEGKRIAGKVSNFRLDPIMKWFRLPWPVKSPSWGNFSLTSGSLLVEGELRESDFQIIDGQYPFQGSYRISWDRQKHIEIAAPGILSPMARFQLDGEIDLAQGLNFQIKTEIIDMKETRAFLQKILNQEWSFPEIRGQAEAEVNIAGLLASPEISVRFESSPAGFAGFNVSQTSGQFSVKAGRFNGDFQFADREIRGKAQVQAVASRTDAFFELQPGAWALVLEGLGIRLPLAGKFNGNFHLSVDKHGEVELKGNFISPQANFIGQEISAVSGEIIWINNILGLRNIKGWLAQGIIEGNLTLDLTQGKYAVDFSGQELLLEKIIPSLRGKADISLAGKGTMGEDHSRGRFSVENPAFSLYRENKIAGEVDILPRRDGLLAEFRSLDKERESDLDLTIEASFNYPQYAVKGKGKAPLLSLFPWRGTEGKFNYLFEIKKEEGKLRTTGVVEASASLLPFPGFAHALTDFSLLAFIEDSNFSIRSFQGKLGGGEVQGFGEIRFGPGGKVDLDIQVDGQDMDLSPFDRTRFLTDASLRLVRNPERFVLEGEFNVKRASWKREFFEKLTISSAGKETPLPEFWQGLSLFLRLRAEDDAWVENSLARVRGRFDLTISGDVSSPLLLGEFEAVDGTVFFQDRTFRLLEGKLSFINPLLSAPYLEMKAETYVQDYRVTFSLVGPIDRLKPEFVSSPPLSAEEVLTLLAFGESFKRITSTDLAAQVSTASFLSGELVEEAKKRAQRFLSLDRLRIDPFVLGSSAEMTARLTVGKKLSENFFIVYSTNLTTQREEIIRLEWEVRPGLSIVGIRDELGRISFDVKIRRRF